MNDTDSNSEDDTKPGTGGAADIEALGVVVGAFESMTPIGRDAALAYLFSRYQRKGGSR